MEQAGTQLAAHPMYVHQPIAGRYREGSGMTKKRDLPWQNTNFHHHQQQQQWFQSANGNWDPRRWEWDSANFVAKATPAEIPLAMATTPAIVESGQRKKAERESKSMMALDNSMDEESENLALKLGGSLYSGEEPTTTRPNKVNGGSVYSGEEQTTRPNKRVRSGSPGTSASYPMCQVDDCKGDLTHAKDYHRRHKVCELHSKTTKALVGKQLQRFCQQCSRFHPLSEFDEGKRSCRRRLAGHNRRRRKTHPEDVSSRPPANMENNSSGNLDIVNLLTVLARLQGGTNGGNAGKIPNGTPIPDKDRLIQILSKLNALPGATNPSSRLPVTGGLDLNLSQQILPGHPNKMNGSTDAPSTMDLLAVLSAAVGASSPDTLANLSRSSHSSNDDRIKMNYSDQAIAGTFQRKPTSAFQPAVPERSCTTFHSPIEVSDGQVQETHPHLPLQLFNSSPEVDRPSKVSARKYLSSDSSNPMEERSPSSSPPVVHKLFPIQNSSENMKHESLSTSGEDNGTAEASTTRGWNSPVEFFKDSNAQAQNSVVRNVTYQMGYASSSGSDHSPSSSNSGAQDRTGRILFKLFDKDPSSFPGTLRTEILNWLSQSPSEIESYIRPGCVVLSIYISMPSTAWKLFHEDLFQRVSSLVQDSGEFWRSGRFLVHTDRQLASHKNGKVHLCKSWRTWSSPELISVMPLAVVGGEKTSLVLRGRNLTVPGTKIHCTYMGGYLSKQVKGSAGTVYDDASSETFSFPGDLPCALGRCFIEVENGFKGNSFPLIIADAPICQELRLLESEFEEEARISDVNNEDSYQDLTRPRSREDVVYFLNELGWLFQRKNTVDLPNFSLTRFKFLFAFSMERDWCALVKKLLDIFVDSNSVKDGLSRESLDMLSEVHLLNRAVKRKCKGMINLLIAYSTTSGGDGLKKYIFPPNQAGPGGVTPLHLAACTHDSEGIIDALTNDPQQIGMSCWNSLPDASGQSPCDYAVARKNYSYNKLVDRKLADRKHGQISIQVGNDALDQSWAMEIVKQLSQHKHGKQSCTKCSTTMTKHYRRTPVVQGVLHRPYLRSMLAVAAVCVCVCLFLRGAPDIGSVAPFKWENLDFGPK
ncbi:Squamosa promoter-binding-like protein [Ranunculus cassubicifolius]